MIQINNTNTPQTLNLKFDESVIASPELIKNGDFADIDTTNLVLNPDFAEIGSDLVTNGDFSAVPLTGGELVVNGNFATDTDWSMNTIWDIDAVNNKATATSSNFTSGTSLNQNEILTVGSWYKVSFEVLEISSGYFKVRTGAGGTWSEDVTSAGTNTYYLQATNNEDGLYGHYLYISCSSITNGSISNVSVVEVVNLVSNPNFTDTGADLLTQPIDLTIDFDANSGGVIVDADTFTTAGGSLDGLLSKVSSWNLDSGKSYKLVIAGSTTSSGFTIGDGVGTGSEYGSDFGTHYFVSLGTRLWIRQNTSGTTDLTTFTIEKLGSDWSENGDDPDSVSFGENGVTIVQSSDLGIQNRASQSSVTESGKSYKVTYTIYDASYTLGNSAKYYDGDSYVDLPEQGAGTHTFYFTREGEDNNTWYFNLNTPVDEVTDFVTISSLLVQELGEGWTVSAEGGISFNASGLSLDSSKIDTSGGGLVYGSCSQTATIFELGKSYKLVIENLDITSGSIELKWGRNFNSTPQREILTSADNGTYTDYFTAVSTADSFTINSAGGTVATLRSITVQEVGQDWTVGDGWTVEDNKAVCDGTQVSFSALQQEFVFTNTESYKMTFDITSNQEFIKFWVNGSQLIFSSSLDDGSKEYYFTASVSGSAYFEATSSFEGSITNVVVQQLDPNDYWTFGDGWGMGEDKAICIADGGYNVLNQGFVLDSGSDYKVTYTADLSLITSGSLKLNAFSNSVTDRTVIDGTNTAYLTANGTSFQVNMGGAIGTATITNISVYNIDGLVDIEFINQLTLKAFDFPNIPVLSTNGRYSSLSIIPPVETTPPSNATMEEGMYLVTFKLDQTTIILATRLAFVGSVPAFKEASYDAYKVGDGTAYNVYVNG